MKNYFRREAKLMVLWPVWIVILGLAAAVVVPILLKHR
jgi:hypothetical protein